MQRLRWVAQESRREAVIGLVSRKEAPFIMAEILEAAMLLCFGLSWPLNAYKGFHARTAAGTSWQFIALITAGYLAGIAAKLVTGTVTWVLAVYVVNLVCLGINWAVYFRNRRLDAAGLGSCDRKTVRSAA